MYIYTYGKIHMYIYNLYIYREREMRTTNKNINVYKSTDPLRAVECVGVFLSICSWGTPISVISSPVNKMNPPTHGVYV